MLEMRRGGLCGAIRVFPNWVLRFLFQWPEAGVEEDKALLIKSQVCLAFDGFESISGQGVVDVDPLASICIPLKV